MRTVTAQPGHSASEVTDLLATKQFVYAECFTLTLKDGTKLYYTTAQQNVSVVPLGGSMYVNFLANQVLISGMKFKLQIGVSVDEQQVTISCAPSVLLHGIPFMQAMLYGYLDGATIDRDRFFAASWGSPWLGGAPMFHGNVSTLNEVGRTQAKITVKSQLVLLDMNMPRTPYGPNCQHTLYDTGCTLDRNSFVAHATVGAGATNSVLPWTGATDDYQLGSVYIENSASVTFVRTIQSVDPGVSITLGYPLPWTPVAGDLFNAYEGCDRTNTRCTALGNTDHFRGFRFVPAAETGV